jgi:glycosyltransferase involved in cell wall biosynthesis
MKRVNQILPYYWETDPYCETALQLHEVLLLHDISSQIYVRDEYDAFSSFIQPVEKMGLGEEGLSLFHCFGREPLDLGLLSTVRGKKVLFQHFSPKAETFAPFSSQLHQAVLKSRNSLKAASSLFDLAIADCHSTLVMLHQLGFPNAKMMRSSLVPRDFSFTSKSDLASNYKKEGGMLWMASAPISPHQRLEDTIRLFSWYRRFYRSDCLLLIAGHTVSDDYLLSLRDLTHSLSVQRSVFFMGNLGMSETKACYESADLFLSLADVDLPRREFLEVAGFEVPILTFGHAGAREFLGDKGTYVNSRDIPVMAELVDFMSQDQGFRKKIIRHQKDQLHDYLCRTGTAPLGREFLQILQ